MRLTSRSEKDAGATTDTTLGKLAETNTGLSLAELGPVFQAFNRTEMRTAIAMASAGLSERKVQFLQPSDSSLASASGADREPWAWCRSGDGSYEAQSLSENDNESQALRELLVRQIRCKMDHLCWRHGISWADAVRVMRHTLGKGCTPPFRALLTECDVGSCLLRRSSLCSAAKPCRFNNCRNCSVRTVQAFCSSTLANLRLNHFAKRCCARFSFYTRNGRMWTTGSSGSAMGFATTATSTRCLFNLRSQGSSGLMWKGL